MEEILQRLDRLTERVENIEQAIFAAAEQENKETMYHLLDTSPEANLEGVKTYLQEFIRKDAGLHVYVGVLTDFQTITGEDILAATAGAKPALVVLLKRRNKNIYPPEVSNSELKIVTLISDYMGVNVSTLENDRYRNDSELRDVLGTLLKCRVCSTLAFN